MIFSFICVYPLIGYTHINVYTQLMYIICTLIGYTYMQCGCADNHSVINVYIHKRHVY